MADINLNAATYEQIVTLLSHLATNYSNLVGTFYDVFYNETPENVTFQMFDDSGVLKDFTVKNLALSNEYRKTGNTAPTQNLDKGTLYQDLSSGDVYTKVTGADSNQGWEKLVNSTLLGTFILHGNGNPDGVKEADLGTLYVDIVNVALYICVGDKSWAPISSSFLEFANRSLDNITESGRDVIRSIVTQQVGDKTETVNGSSTNGQFPTALAVYQAISEAADRKQDKNMTTVLSSESTDSQYPSAKCVYDAINQVSDEISTVQADLGTVKADINTIKDSQFEVYGTDGISVDRQLVSSLVSVETSNPDLTITEDYDGVKNPRTVLGTETTTLTVDGTLDDTKYSGTESEAYYIRNGKLFDSSNKLVSDLVGWTDITGSSDSAYGICNGSLYNVGTEGVASLGLGCIQVAGNYCISDNKTLYYLSGTSYTSVQSSGTGWIDITGSYSSSTSALGIKESNEGDNKGSLYKLNGTTMTSITEGGAEWTSIKGGLSEYVLGSRTGALGICNGDLYAIYYNGPSDLKVRNIGSSHGSTWLGISDGFSYDLLYTYYSYAILGDGSDNSKGDLYRLEFSASGFPSDIDYIGTSNKWIKVSGQVNQNTSAYAIRADGRLMLLGSNSISSVGSSTSWIDVFAYSSDGTDGQYSKNVYGICDNKMYKLEGATATLLYDLKENSEIVSPEDYGITSITGDVQQGDTVTLTYNTENGRVIKQVEHVFDGPWVTANHQITSTSGTVSGTEYTLSTYLPNDNYNYMVTFGLFGYDSNNSYAYHINTDLANFGTNTSVNVDNAFNHIYGGQYSRQNMNLFELPVGIERYVKLYGSGAESVKINMYGYRRMGTNP